MNPQPLLHWRTACLVSIFALAFSLAQFIPGQAALLPQESFNTARTMDLPPHPLLSDVNVRRALAYCTDRRALLTTVAPEMSEELQDTFLMDTFLPKSHWAYHAPSAEYQYPFNAALGRQLLEDAGWLLPSGATYRRNAEGYELAIKLTTTDAQFRQLWATALEEQWRTNCGIRLLRSHIAAQVFFGRDEGSLIHRDFELAALAWVGQASIGGQSLYGCDFIPTRENGWFGQNHMGWCNPAVDTALARAYNTLDREEILEQYVIVQEEFAKEMVSLPLFARMRVYATTKALENFQPDPTEYDTWNAHEWVLPGHSTLVMVESNGEPANLLFGTSGSLARLQWLLFEEGYSQRNYDYQPVLLTELPTLESGLAQNEDVNVAQGEAILDADGNLTTLEPGVQIRRADGEIITYSSGTVVMKQLTVEHNFQPNLRWSDGEFVKQADFELAHTVDCDPASHTLLRCDVFKRVAFADHGYTITYVPGNQNALYYLPPFLFYPAHQQITSGGPHQGKTLAEVPLVDWYELPEVVETPLATGPYQVAEWVHGDRLILEPNAFYWRGADSVHFDQLIVEFATDLEAIAQEVDAGTIHIAESVFVSGSSQVENHFLSSPTWEHVDMNLNLYTQASARVLPVAGGDVSTDIGISLTVPSGVLPSTSTAILNDLSVPSQSLAGMGTSVRAFSIDIVDANGEPLVELAQPVTVHIQYGDEQLGAVNEQTINIMYWDGEGWVELLPCTGCFVDIAANRIVVQVEHLSEFAVAGDHLLFVPSLSH